MPLNFAPDADPTLPGNISVDDNFSLGVGTRAFRPTPRGYANVRKPQLFQASGSVPGSWGVIAPVPNSMFAHNYQSDGRILAGSVNRLVELSLTGAGTFSATDVSQGLVNYVSPSYVGGADDESDPRAWTFASFGQYVFASNKFNPMQVQTAKAGQFANSSDGPACGTMCVFKNFLVCGNVTNYGAVTGTKDMVAWSPKGNPLGSWVPSPATEAGYQQIVDEPGRVIAVRPLGDAIAVYKSNAIFLMRYVGNPSTFSVQQVVKGIGVNGGYGRPPPIVDTGRTHIFVGRDDIYEFDGTNCVSLGTGTIKNYLLAGSKLIAYPNTSAAYFDAQLGRIINTNVSHDLRNGEIYFWQFNLLYNYRLRRWGMTGPYYGSLATVSCEASSLSVGGGTPGLINDPGTMTVSNTGSIYNQYLYHSSSTQTLSYDGMYLLLRMGANDRVSTIQRVVPRFMVNHVPTDPTDAATKPKLYYRYRQNLAGTATFDPASGAVANPAAVWDDTNMRWDMMRAAYWHDLYLVFPDSRSEFELNDLQYTVSGAGKNVERATAGPPQ